MSDSEIVSIVRELVALDLPNDGATDEFVELLAVWNRAKEWLKKVDGGNYVDGFFTGEGT